MNFTPDYSGIIAIFVYLFLLIAFSKLKKKKAVEEETENDNTAVAERSVMPLDLNDEDATVACLVAAIECRNEFHKNVQILSVRRIG